ncbi:hypothetical protein [Yoonia sp.]|uniref:hypothetical protein n=1 Tax=Yoonia sp. TaxID=2212373 RepID=UPI0035C854C8
MKRLSLILALAALSACGADGAPFAPTASVGIGVGSGGLTTGANVGASNGTVSIGVGI